MKWQFEEYQPLWQIVSGAFFFLWLAWESLRLSEDKNSSTGLNYCVYREENHSPRHWCPSASWPFVELRPYPENGKASSKTIFESNCVQRNPSSIIQGFENNFGHPSLFLSPCISRTGQWQACNLAPPLCHGSPGFSESSSINFKITKLFKSNEINIGHPKDLPESL